MLFFYYSNSRTTGEYDAAEEKFKRILQINPKHFRCLGNYAVFLKNIRKDYDGAEKIYKSALAINPKHVPTLNNYALFLKIVRSDHVEETLKAAMDIDPKNLTTLNNYGIIFFHVLLLSLLKSFY